MISGAHYVWFTFCTAVS